MREDGQLRCESGYEWQDADDPDNYICVPTSGGEGEGEGEGEGVTGGEGGACYGNGTCDEGLTCDGDVCLDPYAALDSGEVVWVLRGEAEDGWGAEDDAIIDTLAVFPDGRALLSVTADDVVSWPAGSNTFIDAGASYLLSVGEDGLATGIEPRERGYVDLAATPAGALAVGGAPSGFYVDRLDDEGVRTQAADFSVTYYPYPSPVVVRGDAAANGDAFVIGSAADVGIELGSEVLSSREFIARLSPAGQRVWAAGTEGYIVPLQVAATPEDGVVVLSELDAGSVFYDGDGDAYSPTCSGRCAVVLKLSATGQHVWQALLSSSQAITAAAETSAISVTADGNVVFSLGLRAETTVSTGAQSATITAPSYGDAVIALSASGSLLWARIFGGITWHRLAPHVEDGLVFAARGGPSVSFDGETHTFDPATQSETLVIVHLRENGDFGWKRVMPARDLDLGGLRVAERGVWVAGSFHGELTFGEDGEPNQQTHIATVGSQLQPCLLRLKP